MNKLDDNVGNKSDLWLLRSPFVCIYGKSKTLAKSKIKYLATVNLAMNGLFVFVSFFFISSRETRGGICFSKLTANFCSELPESCIALCTLFTFERSQTENTTGNTTPLTFPTTHIPEESYTRVENSLKIFVDFLFLCMDINATLNIFDVAKRWTKEKQNKWWNIYMVINFIYTYIHMFDGSFLWT